MNLKKVTLALLALGISGAAFAGSFAPTTCKMGDVKTPCERSAWDLGFDLMYVQPSIDGLAYVTRDGVAVATGTVNTTTNTTSYLNPKYDFGFRLEGSYHWGDGQDLTVNWLRFDESSTRTTTVTDNTLDGWNEVSGKVNNKFDDVNFEWGQQINVGANVATRFHFGAQYVRLDTTGTENYSDGLAVNDVTINQGTSKFEGFGPRAGIDSSYNFGNGFALVGRAAAGLLVADLKSSTSNSVYVAANPQTTVTITDGGTEHVVVPTADARLAVRYTHPMAQGDLSIEGGWHFQHVAHAVQLAPGAGFAASNFGLQGPYLGLKWMGNLA